MKLREFIDSTKQLLDACVFGTAKSHLNCAFLELCSASDENRLVDEGQLLKAVFFWQSKLALSQGSVTLKSAWSILYADIQDKPDWGYKDLLVDRLKEHFATAEYSDEFKELWLTLFAKGNEPLKSKYTELNSFIEDFPINAMDGEPTAPHAVHQQTQQQQFLLSDPDAFITISLDEPPPNNAFQPTPYHSFLFNALAASALTSCVVSLSIVVLAFTSVITLSAPWITAAGVQAAMSGAVAAYSFFKGSASPSNNDVANQREFTLN